MKPRKELECHDLKFIGNLQFYDYWDLKTHPLYISATKSKSPYIKMDEIPFKDSEEVSSLTAISRYLAKYNWIYEPRYWKKVAPHIQASLNVPFS